MKNITITITFFLFSVCASAQDNKPKAGGRPTEQSEIAADNHLKKVLQQKQLGAAPEKIVDVATTSTARKPIKKKRKCGTKTPSNTRI